MTNTASDNLGQPKLASHCAALYARLEQASNEVEGEVVWTGKITDAATGIGIPIGSYMRVINALRKLGCIEQLERGARNRGTTYRLCYPPTPEVWRERAPESTQDLTRAPSLDILSAQFDDLREQMETQLGGIILVDALQELAAQIAELSTKVAQIEKDLQQQTATTQ